MGSQLNLKVRKLPHSGGSQGSCLLPGTLIPMACTLGKQGQKAEQVPISHTNIPKSKLLRAREGHRVPHRNSGAHKSGGVGSGQESHLSRSKPGEFGSEPHGVHCASAGGTPLASPPSSPAAPCSPSPARSQAVPLQHSASHVEEMSRLLGVCSLRLKGNTHRAGPDVDFPL